MTTAAPVRVPLTPGQVRKPVAAPTDSGEATKQR
jgi:hypothetical protein